jgi:hypothetical protein
MNSDNWQEHVRLKQIELIILLSIAHQNKWVYDIAQQNIWNDDIAQKMISILRYYFSNFWIEWSNCRLYEEIITSVLPEDKPKNNEDSKIIFGWVAMIDEN